jgi:hypothetical protein
MIDEDLREMFAERERFVPDPSRVATRIATEVRRRRGRTQAVRAIAVAAAVVATVVAVGAVVSTRPWAAQPPIAPTTGPAPSIEPSPGPSPTLTAGLVGRLVAAPDDPPAIKVTPTWLPPDLKDPKVFTFVDTSATSATITYERTPSLDPGTESVSVQTWEQLPPAPADPSANTSPPDWVTHEDNGTADVNGHQAAQHRMSSRSVGSRSCDLIWQQRPGLWIDVSVSERTTDTTLTCVNGLRVARSVVEQPTSLARTVRLTEVPDGYVRVQTGTNLDRWCPDNAANAKCVGAQSGRNYAPTPGAAVTVHGHPGSFSVTGSGFLLNVPGWIRIFSEGADLTEEEILAMAESAVLDGGW